MLKARHAGTRITFRPERLVERQFRRRTGARLQVADCQLRQRPRLNVLGDGVAICSACAISPSSAWRIAICSCAKRGFRARHRNFVLLADDADFFRSLQRLVERNARIGFAASWACAMAWPRRGARTSMPAPVTF
jgi:hypothetical protein